MTSFMALDGVTSFLRLKDVTITCKRMRRSLNIGGNSSVQWRKVGRSWRLRMCFRRLLFVRIEIDQLYCVNCWVIIHCLSVSCGKINHSRCALVIWSSLQLTSKQWIITQQFTAGADLFLNIPFLTLDFSKQNGVSINFRTSLRRHNVIYTRATFSRTKASAKWSVTAATHSNETSCMRIRAQFRLF